MPLEILYSETYGSDGSDFVYIKPNDQTGVVRIDSSLRARSHLFDGFVGVLTDVFLPQGYPESVSQDYVSYQLWDTVQAFCSTISNTFTTQAILKGVGVGDNIVSPISAAITWILKDGTGMLARILFAWISGSGLDAECKKWRLFADFVNDTAMFIELLLLPSFPKHSMYILCFSTSMKAVVGVAGGATRAAITQHQAVQGNTGDVSAKDGSQETCVNLLASLMGVFILSTLGDSEHLWFLFCGMTLLHLYANYRAVRSLNFFSFNSERLAILIRTYLVSNTVAHPVYVNKRESVFLGIGTSDKELCGYRIKMGCSLQNLLKDHSLTSQEFRLLSNIYKSRKFMLLTSVKEKTVYVVLDRDHSVEDVFEVYFQAVLFGIAACYINKESLAIMKGDCIVDNSDSIVNALKNVIKPYEKAMVCNRLPIEAVIATDHFAAKESSKFISNIKKQGWWTDQHYIKVDKWRGSWSTALQATNESLTDKF